MNDAATQGDEDAVNPFVIGAGRSFLGSHLRRDLRHRLTRRLFVSRVLLCCLAVGVGFCACGYHFVGNDVQAPGNMESIAVGVVENKTTIVGIETIFTNALLNEFIRTQRLVVKPPTEADGILSGAITNIRTEAVSHRAAEKTLETRVTVTLSLTLKHRASGEILWENKSLSYYQEYTDTELPLATSENRRLAIAYIANFLAEKVYQDIFARF